MPLDEAFARCGRPEIFKYRPGQPVHQRGVHRSAVGERDQDQHGRSWLVGLDHPQPASPGSRRAPGAGGLCTPRNLAAAPAGKKSGRPSTSWPRLTAETRVLTPPCPRCIILADRVKIKHRDDNQQSRCLPHATLNRWCFCDYHSGRTFRQLSRQSSFHTVGLASQRLTPRLAARRMAGANSQRLPSGRGRAPELAGSASV